jgi:malonate decarboxylase epsilon subunit
VNALLFPGQGAQYAGLLAKTASMPGARQLLARASEIVGQDVSITDDEASLQKTDVVQRNTFLASVASADALRANGALFDAVAGHSIGAFAAAHFAGVLEFEDALRLVVLRGGMMRRLFCGGYAMGAIVGFDERTVQNIIAKSEGVSISGVNARDQVTIVGPQADVLAALDTARQSGAVTAKLLAVTVPSHSDLMIPVRDALRDGLSKMRLGRPTLVYAANTDGRAKIDSRDVAADLIESVARPVRWHDAIAMLVERGVRSFVEAAPGDTLTTLINNRSEAGAEAIAVDRAGLDEVSYWLGTRYR